MEWEDWQQSRLVSVATSQTWAFRHYRSVAFLQKWTCSGVLTWKTLGLLNFSKRCKGSGRLISEAQTSQAKLFMRLDRVSPKSTYKDANDYICLMIRSWSHAKSRLIQEKTYFVFTLSLSTIPICQISAQPCLRHGARWRSKKFSNISSRNY